MEVMLFEACKKGDLEAVNQILEKGNVAVDTLHDNVTRLYISTSM